MILLSSFPRGLVRPVTAWGCLLVLSVPPAVAAEEQGTDRAGSEVDLVRVFSVGNIAPRGRIYRALVPDTLDLSERARLAVSALTETLNPGSGYGPYGHAFFKVRPPYMSERMYAPKMDAGTANWGKVMEALVLMRSMCGSEQNLEIESRSLRGMIAYVNGSGCPYQDSRAVMALIDLYRQRPNPELKRLINGQVRRLHEGLQGEGDLVWYEDPRPATDRSDLGISNYETQAHQHGGPIWALCQWYDVQGNAVDLDLAGRLSRFVRQPRFWEPEVEPRFFVGAERAHFKGHVHSYLVALLGILAHARLTGDAWAKEFVRNGYEYVRNLGIARLGVFGETCSLAEMVIIAAELSEMGIADCWDHVDQYTRNHLAEMQFVDPDRVRSCVGRMPTLAMLPRTGDEDVFQTRDDCVEGKDTTARMLERNLGAFFTDAGHPDEIPRRNWTWTVCCTANGAKGLYHAWKSIVRCEDGVARINLLLNRASPWLDIDSYLPYQGKVVIRNKSAKKIAVRLPGWVDEKAVTGRIGDRPASQFWIGRYLVFPSVEAGGVITIEFPVVETTETYTLKWKREDRWFESNWPGGRWQAGGDKYVCRFRGNTLVEIAPVPSPSREAQGYPLYQRAAFRGKEAPMKEVSRFVPEDR